MTNQNLIEKRLRKIMKPTPVTNELRLKDVLLHNCLQAYRITKNTTVVLYRIEQDGANYVNWIVDMIELNFKQENRDAYTSGGLAKAGMNPSTDTAILYVWKPEDIQGKFEATLERHVSQGYTKAIIKYIL